MSTQHSAPETDVNQKAPRFLFRTTHLPQKDQFEIFATAMGSMSGLVLPEGVSAKSGFAADQQGYRLGRIGILVSATQDITLTRSKHHVAQFGSGDWMLWFNLRGAADTEMGGTATHIEPGSLSLYDLERPAALHFNNHDNNTTVFIFLPRKLFGGIEHLMNDITQLRSQRPHFHPLLNHYFYHLIEMLPNLKLGEELLAEQITVAMIQACVSKSRDRISAARRPILATQLTLAKRYISAHLQSPGLTRRALEKALGISSRQLFYVFAENGGVDHYIREQRLKACFRRFADQSETRPIAQIAEQFGFMDASNFNRVFKLRYDRTPGDIRAHATKLKPQTHQFWNWLHSRPLPDELEN